MSFPIFESRSWPTDPTGPSAAPEGYTTPTQPASSPTSGSPFTDAEIAARRGNFYELILRQVVLAVTGLFVPNATSFTQLQDWANSVGLGDIFEVLTGIPDADNNDLGTWVGQLLGIFKPVPQIQAASVVDTNPNLILEPNFSSSSTIVLDLMHNWSWDNSAGHNSIGSAKVIAIGVLDELLSNEILAVPGQKLDLSAWVKWTGVSFTGSNPITLGVTRYKEELRSDGLFERNEVGSEDLVFIASPAASSDWVQLAVTGYVVPAGTDEFRLRLKIAENLTAGTLYWDDMEVKKTQPGSGFIGSLLDTTINGLENLDNNSWGLDDLLASMLNQFRTTTDHSTRITLLEQLNSTGNKVNDEFFRVGSTLGADWNQTYIGGGGGTWQTDGDYARWYESGFSGREVRARYIGTPSTTATDTQKIIAVTGSGGEVVNLFFLGFFHSAIDLYGRMDAGETNWIRARFWSGGSCEISRSISGSVTQLASIGCPAPGGGSTIQLVCGTASGPRFFQAYVNGVLVLETSDATSNLGASYRGYGHGALAQGSILILGQTSPPRLNAWAAQDN